MSRFEQIWCWGEFNMQIKKLPTLPMLPKKKQVAAYARVSSGKDAMLHSLSAQVSYYSEYIQKNPEWLYCGVYVDEAITGTRTERPEFQRMLSDCRAGKIDLVITKSISRFARNTVTLLETVRELKSLGIDVFFEEPNIHTLSAAGEMMLTILASVAQEESRTVSENMKWRVRMNFEAGQPWGTNVLGYRCINGRFVKHPEEAGIVQKIFALYESGFSYRMIAETLNKEGLRTRFGNRFDHNAVKRVLLDYLYTGNILLQQTYVENHISKTKRKNTGEMPQYHVQQAHDPLVELERFRNVQASVLQKQQSNCQTGRTITYTVLSGKVVCSLCGNHYRRKRNHGRYVWICSTYNNFGKAACASRIVPEDVLLEAIGKDEIQEIYILPDQRLRLEYTNGTQNETVWQNRSRADSWTDAMKQEASEKTYGRYHKNTGDEK